jgi:hypothetical protein
MSDESEGYMRAAIVVHTNMQGSEYGLSPAWLAGRKERARVKVDTERASD